jgi:hypothetical protein
VEPVDQPAPEPVRDEFDFAPPAESEVFQPAPASSYRPKTATRRKGFDPRLIYVGVAAVLFVGILLLQPWTWVSNNPIVANIKAPKPGDAPDSTEKPLNTPARNQRPPADQSTGAGQSGAPVAIDPLAPGNVEPPSLASPLEGHALLTKLHETLQSYAQSHDGLYPVNIYDIFSSGFANQGQFREEPGYLLIMAPNIPRTTSFSSDMIVANVKNMKTGDELVLFGDGSIRDVSVADWYATIAKSNASKGLDPMGQPK